MPVSSWSLGWTSLLLSVLFNDRTVVKPRYADANLTAQCDGSAWDAGKPAMHYFSTFHCILGAAARHVDKVVLSSFAVQKCTGITLLCCFAHTRNRSAQSPKAEIAFQNNPVTAQRQSAAHQPQAMTKLMRMKKLMMRRKKERKRR